MNWIIFCSRWRGKATVLLTLVPAKVSKRLTGAIAFNTVI